MYTQTLPSNSNTQRTALIVLFFCLSMLFRFSAPGQTVKSQPFSQNPTVASAKVNSISTSPTDLNCNMRSSIK